MRTFKYVLLPLLLLMAGAGIALGADRKVLILSADDMSLPGARLYNEAIRSTLTQRSDRDVQFFEESLEDSRIPTDSYEKEEVAFLKQKYAAEHFDCIFAYGTPSLKFLLRHESELFTNVPKIYLLLDERTLAGIDLGTNTTGAAGRIQFAPTLELMLAQNPSTRKVAVVNGSSPLDKAFQAQVKKDFAPYVGRVEFQYISDVTLEELRKTLAEMSSDTVVFFTAFLADTDGKVFSYPAAIEAVAPTSAVPIYGTADTGIGAGIVGGNLISFENQGKIGAQMALRIFNGEKAQEIEPQVSPSLMIFDWRALHRWGISDSRLPAGSILKFREPTAWEQYRVYIIVGLALLIFQSFLIASMLISRRRKLMAEAEKEQFQAMAALEHKRVNEIVSNIPGIVWESRITDDPDHRRVTFVSAYVEQMLGYTVDEFMSEDNFVLTRVLVEERAAFETAAQAAFGGDDNVSIQFRCFTKSGDCRWVEAQVVAVRDDAGKAIGLRGVLMDITERKQAEQEVVSKERQLTEAQRLAQVGSWEWVSENDTVTWSDEMYRIYGLDPAGPPVSYADHGRLFVPESWERLQAAVEVSIEAGEPFDVELQVVRPDGESLWVNARGEVVHGEGTLAMRGTVQDISLRKQADEALLQSETRFRQMADTAPVFIWMADEEMLFTYFNQKVLDFTGKSIKELSGKAWLNHVHKDDLEKCVSAYSSSFREHKPFVMEYRLKRSDGEYCWFYDTGNPRFASNGAFVGYIGSAVDITDRKSAETSLQSALQQIHELKDSLHEENIYLKEMIKLEHDFDEIIGNSDALKYVLFKIEQVAPTDATVLITGETGTGKELVARAIHDTSLRRDRPMIKVNCAALSPTLIESELFGHERGAFTGASERKIGRFELADGTTIFLDEVGELPMELQSKLLRLLQEGEFERLGSTDTLKADVRIIAATNRNLEFEVRNGRFREDLLFRLNVFPVTVPPLRDRREDIPLLVEHFTKQFSKKLGKSLTSISPSTFRTLSQYHWPGNIRELANVIERGVIGSRGSILRVNEPLGSSERDVTEDETFASLESVERSHIIKTLLNTGWRIDGPNGAARILGINPSTLRTRMNKLGIVKTHSRSV